MTRRLPRVLRFFDISVLASAAMGPAYSIASTMGPLVAAAGGLAPVSLVALGAIMLCIAIGFSQLARVAPNAGSSYSWIRLAFGSRAGAYGAWLLLLSNFFATMAIAVPAGIYTLDLLAPNRAQDPVWDAAVGAVWIIGSTILLYVGLRPTAVVTATALALELGVLGVSAAVALVLPHHAIPHPVGAAGVSGAQVAGVSLFGFITAMTLGVWMSDGWEVSASASEEVQGDGREAGRGGIMGLVVTMIVLAGATAAYLHLGSIAGFVANQADAMRYVADLLGSGAWRPVIITTVLVSTCSTLWTTILYLSRSVFAMGRDGVLPRALGKLDARNEPLWSLAVVAILVTACELLTGFSKTAADALNAVLNASSVFLGLLFVFSAAAATRIFWKTARRWRGVIIPSIGAAALLGVIGATIATEDRSLQLIALVGLLIGIPFAFWRSDAPAVAGSDRHARLLLERDRVFATAAQVSED
ncbi:MAG TPA: APC family permease [Candidatus Baltobacteraceae bacterium]|nr:APC family permease [Candidatus Baltobacteraceae bacterium]